MNVYQIVFLVVLFEVLVGACALDYVATSHFVSRGSRWQHWTMLMFMLHLVPSAALGACLGGIWFFIWMGTL